MNILKYPDEANPGALVTAAEFEEAAIHAQLMEDLLDRDDLAPGEFLDRAIGRANQIRTPQNLHLWVSGPHRQSVFLVRASLVPGLERMNALARALTQQVDNLHRTISEFIDAGSKP